MVYISKNLKSWVKSDLQAMNEAYDECWRQKENWKQKVNPLLLLLGKIKENQHLDCSCEMCENMQDLIDYYNKIKNQGTK